MPRGGPIAGGTDIRLHGHGLPTGSFPPELLVCEFAGELMEHGRMEREADSAGSFVRCRTPALAVSGSVSVRLSLDGGVKWAGGSTAYFYYDPPMVRALDPSLGPMAGGTEIVVLGAGFGPFHQHLGGAIALCRFGSDSSAPPHAGSAGAALQPAGTAVGDPLLRTHIPRFVTTAATIVHQGAARCRVPASHGLATRRSS